MLLFFAEAHRKKANMNAVQIVVTSRFMVTHADIGFGYIVATEEHRQLGVIPEKDDVRNKMQQQKYLQHGSTWLDSATYIGKYAEKCLENCVKDMDLLYASIAQ